MKCAIQKFVLIEAEMKREGQSPSVGLTEPSMGQTTKAVMPVVPLLSPVVCRRRWGMEWILGTLEA